MKYKKILEDAGPLKEKAAMLFAVLSEQPNQKVFSEAVAGKLGIAPRNADRTIRALCSYLGLRGICILGDNDGVWLSDKPNDIRAYIERRKKEADAAYATTMERLNAMHRTAHLLEFGSVSEQINIFAQ